MPGKSKAQQRAAAIAYAKKCKGEKLKLKGAAKQMAGMSCEQLKEFAQTKRKRLPKHAKKGKKVGRSI